MKKNLIYLALLLIISGTWYALQLKKKQDHQKLVDRRNELVFQNFNEANIHFIDLELPGERIALALKDGQWQFTGNGLSANELYVQILLGCIKQLTYGDVISERVEDHANYKLDSQSRLVILRDANAIEQARVYIGKPGENYRTAFFRLGDSATVYHTVTDCYPALTRSCWYDRTIWQVSESAINKFKFIFKKETTIYRKEEDRWVTQTGATLPKEQCESLFHLVASHAEYTEVPIAKAEAEGEIHLFVGNQTMSLLLFKSNNGYHGIRPSIPGMLFSLPVDFLDHFRLTDVK